MFKLHLIHNTLLPAINPRTFCFCFLALLKCVLTFLISLSLSLSEQVCTACLVIVVFVQCAPF